MSAVELSNTFNAPMVSGKKIEQQSVYQSPSKIISKVLSNSTLQKHGDKRGFQERFPKTLANKFVTNSGKPIIKNETISANPLPNITA